MAAISGSIDGHADFELGVPRTVPVTYVAEVPETDRADGLVFLIAGFGGDKDESLMELTRRHIAAKHNLIVVSVRAHCHFCRISQSTAEMPVELQIDPWSIAKAIGALVLQGDSLDGLAAADEASTLQFLKSRQNHTFELTATLVPPGEDYQNFGVLAALDHLKVLNHLIEEEELAFETSNVVLAGTSHGAYIANLMQKFAPNTISAIIDSSSFPETMPTYLGFGGVEVRAKDGNLEFICSTKTAWTNEFIGAPTYFGLDQTNIRHLAYPAHLDAVGSVTGHKKCQFRMIHSTEDKLVNINLKRHHAEMLERYGHDVVLDEVGEADLDGKFITTLEHGMGISLNKLFDRYYPTLKRLGGVSDRDNETKLTFTGVHKTYSVIHGAKSGPVMSASVIQNRDSDILSA
jgi:DUF2920 family protein